MRKAIFFCLCFFIFIGYCNANVVTYNRNDMDNYGVNKNIVIDNHNRPNVLNTPAVNAEDKIYDFSNILEYNEEYVLKELIHKYRVETGFELVILTDSFYNRTDKINADYAQDFYDYNDFGINNDYYSGVIIFRNSYSDYPYYAVYSFGEAQYYYVDGNSTRLGYTLDRVYPYMTSGDYVTAMSNIITDLLKYYKEGPEDGMEDYYLDEDGMLVHNPKFNPPIYVALVISIIVTWLVISSNLNKNKTVFKEKYAHNYLEQGSIKYTRKEDIKYDSRTISHVISNSSSSGGRSGGGGSFSSSRGSSGLGRSGGGRRG